MIRRSYKYRIYPTKKQISYFENCFSMCRHLYNWALIERKEAFEKDQTKIRYQDQQNGLLKQVKEERPWYQSVHSLALQDVLHRLDNAYKGFYRRVTNKKKGVAFGYPKYKRQGDWNSLTYAQYTSKKPTL